MYISLLFVKFKFVRHWCQIVVDTLIQMFKVKQRLCKSRSIFRAQKPVICCD